MIDNFIAGHVRVIPHSCGLNFPKPRKIVLPPSDSLRPHQIGKKRENYGEGKPTKTTNGNMDPLKNPYLLLNVEKDIAGSRQNKRKPKQHKL